MNKRVLINMFALAREKKFPYVFVGIEAEGIKEIIAVPEESFDAKEKFYLNAYSDDLVHVMNSNVRIVNVVTGDIESIDWVFDDTLPDRLEVSGG